MKKLAITNIIAARSIQDIAYIMVSNTNTNIFFSFSLSFRLAKNISNFLLILFIPTRTLLLCKGTKNISNSQNFYAKIA